MSSGGFDANGTPMIYQRLIIPRDVARRPLARQDVPHMIAIPQMQWMVSIAMNIQILTGQTYIDLIIQLQTLGSLLQAQKTSLTLLVPKKRRREIGRIFGSLQRKVNLRRDDTIATRIFEPSDSWKRDHNDRPGRNEDYNHPTHVNHGLPDRPARAGRGLPPIPGGDRYRPQQSFYPHHARGEYDSYRPPYEGSWSPTTTRESISAPLHRRGPSGSYPKRGQADYRGGASVSPKIIHRLPVRRSHEFSFSTDRNFYPNDHKYDRDDDDRSRSRSRSRTRSRSRSRGSRASSRSSIASSVPSEKAYTPSRSTLSLAPEQQSSAQARGDAGDATSEPPQPATGRLSPSPYPPGLDSFTNTGPTSRLAEETETPPFRAQAIEDDITEEAEVKEILSQSHPSQLPREKSHSPQASPEKDRHETPSRDTGTQLTSPSPTSPKSSSTTNVIPHPNSPVHNGMVDAPSGAVEDAKTASLTISSLPSPSLPKLPPPPSVQKTPSRDQKPEENNESLPLIVNETQSTPTTSTRKLRARARLAIRTRLSESVIDTPTPTPSLDALRRTTSKSTPATPSTERIIPTTTSTEITVKGDPKLRDALAVIVETRLRRDHQTRDERVNPVLLANLSLSRKINTKEGFGINAEAPKEPDADSVIREVMEGSRAENRMEKFEMLRPSLVDFFSQRRIFINNKILRLKQDYVHLQEKWAGHCHKLNEQAKAPSLLEGETMPIGRTTRRTANLGDAVRSDLEMEQILASLESNDLSDPHYLSQHNLATIPDMISVKNGKVDYLFDDTCHRVENPAEYYAPQTGIHDWTEEEKRIFLDKYAVYPKQFGIIAEFLPNKTASQCVDYYYLHKKQLIDFRKVVSKFGPKRRRRGAGKRKGNALLTDIQKHDEEGAEAEG
ncbi:hypothetical protein NP233_g2829 [Leucocoprinus birnbaumii]|uniref:SANT domain-containing protein n=1 Tax=Leucocoprinus birnbaumii TaxID=56174 RepID=A0AAD5YYF8_9AGAR|nr:hypothetical protein NP233_g2829 [Leucocoprinus birnbaumii]